MTESPDPGAYAVDTEVVIVGAGPTGLLLACELALAGVRTVVLERLPKRIEQVKGGGIQPRSAELLESRGLLAPLLARAAVREPFGGHFAMLSVPLDCTSFDTRHPHPVGLPQWEIEEVLEERATASGVRVLRDRLVTAAAQDDHGVTVTTADGQRLRARYLAACDGAHSTVRRLLDVPFPGRPATQQAVLADVRLAALSPLVPRRAGHISTLTRAADGYWAMLVPLGDDRYRLTFGRTDGSAGPARDSPVTPEEITAALHAVYGPQTVLGAVDNSSRFGDATRQVEHYRVGRVLFAGDAAHVHPPIGGQGINLGLQDAFNLGWKLAATVQDRAPDGLLDSYHAERHPVGAQVLHHTSAQRVLAAPNPPADVAALRDIVTDLLRLPDANRHLAGLMSGLALHYPLPGDHPLTGHRAPDADLSLDGAPTRLSTLLKSGHAVLLDLADAVPPGLDLPPHVNLVRATATTPLGATALLIRPDGYVAWATAGTTATETLLAAVATLATHPDRRIVTTPE
ncbi:FAD-dependent monooxygenase [Kitasatospora sp. NPDC049285]|uniref:FAD-dependent monooxygenase n=1 Tax=Kitasatospora sp. NPDC049285 TaxID=3157096 RepID=UPI003423F313